ncbi:uracil-DNA glycosylase family protein [Pelagerythrobacter aerophilus]
MQEDAKLRKEISVCAICAPYLPLGPRPITQFSTTSRVLIIGQAPGTKVHASGVAWQDDSGNRLREWTGLDRDEFYDPAKVALMPMGFCYPGRAAGGDAPPRPECAPQWHERVLELLPSDRLTLLVGSYAQHRYLPRDAGRTLADRVRAFERFAPEIFPTPHPSWRSVGWQKRNPWFEAELLPRLRAEVRRQVART